MAIIKQIAVFDGTDWNMNKLGANADNVYLINNIAGSSVLQTALNSILPADKLTANKILITDGSGKIAVNNNVSLQQLGYLSSVSSNIQTQLNAKAPLASPTFTGTPKAPNPASSSNDTQIATTKFVKTAVAGKADNDTKNTAGSTNNTSKLYLVGATTQAANPQTYSNSKVYINNNTLYSNNAAVLTAHQSLTAYAKLASPTFTGIPQAPTAASGTKTDQIATTKYVLNAFPTYSTKDDYKNVKGNITISTSDAAKKCCPISKLEIRKYGFMVQVWVTATAKASTEGGSGWVTIASGLPTTAYQTAGWFGSFFGKNPDWFRWQVINNSNNTGAYLQVARYASKGTDTTTNIHFTYMSNVRN